MREVQSKNHFGQHLRGVAAPAMQGLSQSPTAHASHRIIDTGVYLYCRVCGVYGLDKGHNLRARCKGKFADSATKTGGQLSRLRRGLHPLSGRKL